MAVYQREYRSQKTRRPVWFYQFQWQGKAHKQSGFTTRQAAEAAESERKRKLKKEHRQRRVEERHSVPLQKATFREFVPQYLEQRATTHAENTAKREPRRVRPMLEFLGDKLLTDITPADIHAYVAKRKNQDGLAPRTINLELNSLRCLFRYAEELGAAESNPAKKAKNLRESVHVDHWIPTPEELQRFADEAAKTHSGQVLVTWIWFMAYTGTRPAEALFVEWEDIDFEHDRILIRPKPGNPLKNGRARYVEMHAELKAKLLAWQKLWNRVFERRARRYPTERTPLHQWVFYNPRNLPERAKSFLGGFTKARKKSGLPKMTPYTLRHFFISYCVMNGIPMLTIARWVGHSSTKMIEVVYGHLTPDYRAEQMSRFQIGPDVTNGGSEGREREPTT